MLEILVSHNDWTIAVTVTVLCVGGVLFIIRRRRRTGNTQVAIGSGATQTVTGDITIKIRDK